MKLTVAKHQLESGPVLPNPDTCPTCGGIIRVGDWPTCKGDPSKHINVGRLEMGDAPLESYIDHNVSPEPHGVLITSRGQRRQLMKEHGLEYKAKNKDYAPNRPKYYDMSK